MRHRAVSLLLVSAALVGGAGCADDEKHDNADSISGPSIDIHCFGATPSRAVGDTTARVTCPTGFPS